MPLPLGGVLSCGVRTFLCSLKGSSSSHPINLNSKIASSLIRLNLSGTASPVSYGRENLLNHHRMVEDHTATIASDDGSIGANFNLLLLGEGMET